MGSRFFTRSLSAPIAGFLLLVLPGVAAAHATPVLFSPNAGSILSLVPETVSMAFSERIEPGASSLAFYLPGATTTIDMGAEVPKEDQHVLRAPFPFLEQGSYTVLWEVISADDGHFTRGAYSFFVGTTTGATITGSNGFQIVHSSALPEGFSVWLELLGQAMLVGLSAFIIAGFFFDRSFFDDKERRGRVGWYVRFGILFIVSGAALFLFVKANEIVGEGKTFLLALGTISGTVAGKGAIARILLALSALAVFFFSPQKILLSRRLTVPQSLFEVALLAMAYIRAAVSHAAASHVVPQFSVFINWIHLVFKDLWVGMLIALVVFFWKKRNENTEKSSLYPQALLAFNYFATAALFFGGISGAYIIWLHLKGFENIVTTDWGILFLELSFLAAALFALRVHGELVTLPRVLGKKAFFNVSPEFDLYALICELFVGVFILYATSFLIITTPPLEKISSFEYQTQSAGAQISLSVDPYEDGMLLLEIAPKNGVQLQETPEVTIANELAGISDLSVPVIERAAHRYIFPEAVFVPGGQWNISIVVPQKNAYDAVATVSVTTPDDFLDTPSPFVHDGGLFESVLLVAVIALTILSAFSLLYLRRLAKGIENYSSNQSLSFGLAQFLRSFAYVGIFAGLVYIFGFFLSNSSFARQCHADGNMWHMSVPMRAGVALSSRSVYGCLAQEKEGIYHFPNKEEYQFFRSERGR
jgi:methionine-rich copper-binding protein CopC